MKSCGTALSRPPSRVAACSTNRYAVRSWSVPRIPATPMMDSSRSESAMEAQVHGFPAGWQAHFPALVSVEHALFQRKGQALGDHVSLAVHNEREKFMTKA